MISAPVYAIVYSTPFYSALSPCSRFCPAPFPVSGIYFVQSVQFLCHVHGIVLCIVRSSGDFGIHLSEPRGACVYLLLLFEAACASELKHHVLRECGCSGSLLCAR